jgi:hypothetical protein
MHRQDGTVDVSVTNLRVANGNHANLTPDRSVGVRQTVADGDYPALEMEIDTIPTLATQVGGMQFKKAASTDRIYFILYYDGVGWKVAVVTFLVGVQGGGLSPNLPLILGPSVLLQVSRIGNGWDVWTASPDGTSRVWHGHTIFALPVAEISLFADTH